MDKILSARVDEKVIRQIGMLASRLHTSKKAIIEGAIASYAEKIALESKLDILELTSGAWQRPESAEQSVTNARATFRQSMERHHQ